MPSAIHEHPGGLRAWYANLVSQGWVIPGFVTVWAAGVILPLIIVVFYSFFSISNYQVVYEPTVATWPRAQCLGQRNHHRGSSSRTSRAPSAIAASFRNATSRGRCTHPQSGLMTIRSGARTLVACRTRAAIVYGESITPGVTLTQPRPISTSSRSFLRTVKSPEPGAVNSIVRWCACNRFS